MDRNGATLMANWCDSIDGVRALRCAMAVATATATGHGNDGVDELMQGNAVPSAVRAGSCAGGGFRAALMAVGMAVSLSSCSGVADIAPPVPQLAAMPIPAVEMSPAEIVVPMPVPVSLPKPALSPLVERRNGTIKIGKPYSVAGNWYYPAPGAGYDESGIASWYGPDFQGKSTANGEIYNMNRLTAAHPTLPMPCYVTVTNNENGREIVVRINDRGPYKAGRIIDLSHRAAQLLGVTHAGTANVRVRYLKMAPLMADERFEERFLSQQTWYHGPQFAAAGAVHPPANTVALGPRLNLRQAASGESWQPNVAAAQ